MVEKTAASKAKDRKKNLEVEIISQMIILSTSGFGLVAALAWNNVVQSLVNDYIKKFLPGNSGFLSLLVYAIIVTMLAVLITLNLGKIKEKLEDGE